MNPKAIVLAAIRALTTSSGRPTTELVNSDYIEHLDASNEAVRNDRPTGFPVGTEYDILRVITEGDLVLTHGLIAEPGLPALVGVDLWRVDAGRIAERWSSRTPQVGTTASGRSQLDGITEPDATVDASVSKKLVSDWTRAVLLGGDLFAATDYLSERSYAQHNPDVADGTDGFLAAVARLAEVGLSFDYEDIDITIGEGDFVFTRGTGRLGTDVVFNDLWRVAGGRIVEHWDVVAAVGTPSRSAAL